MSAEAVYVAMVVFGYAGALFFTAALLVVMFVFLAAVMNRRSMGHGNTWQGKLRYAITHVFG